MKVFDKKKAIKLLVSPKDLQEAAICIEGGADIIDVKNPKEGSLGGHSPTVIKEIMKMVPDNLELSAAVGDVPNRPGLVAQAALGLAMCGVRYIKIGLCDSFSIDEAIYLVKETVRSVKEVRPQVKIVVCGYADARLKGYIIPKHIPNIVHKGGAQVAMIDTLLKGDGKGLFDYLSEKELRNFQSEAYSYGLEVALAGSLKREDILRIKKERLCDLVGIRTLACSEDKRDGKIECARVRGVKELLIN